MTQAMGSFGGKLGRETAPVRFGMRRVRARPLPRAVLAVVEFVALPSVGLAIRT